MSKYNLKTDPTESWKVRAALQIVNAPNPDWKQSQYFELSAVYDVPLSTYKLTEGGYKDTLLGTAKAKAFAWDKNPNDSFVGFLITVFGSVQEATPIINLDGQINEESILKATRSAAANVVRRFCPSCGKADTLTHSRTKVRCSACRYQESTL